MKTWQHISIAVFFIAGLGTCAFMVSPHNCNASYMGSCTDSYLAYLMIGGLIVLSTGGFLLVTLAGKRGIFEPKSTATVQGSVIVPSSSGSVAASTSPQPLDIQAELQKAADMLKQGLINEAEYTALKAKIINRP